MAWTEIGRYCTGDPDGNAEEFVLEKDDEGNFRITNDFGNSVFEFERMSGYEFFRKVKRDIQNDVESELNDVWNTIDFANDQDDPDNCDDSSTKSNDPNSINNDSFGAD